MLNQDLQDARALLEQSGTEDEKKKYRKAAEIILMKALRTDPENAEAKALLQSARAMQGVPAPPAPAEVKKPASVPVVNLTMTAPQPVAMTANAAADDIPFTTATSLFGSVKEEPKKSSRFMPFAIIVVVVTGGALLFVKQPRAANTNAAAATASHSESAAPSEFAPRPVEVPEPAPAALQLPVSETPSPAPAPLTAPVATPPPAPAPPPPVHLNVQINAQPWAQVFVEGATRRSLGQTPLSGVTVPVGSVLIFENPNFPSKTYRITEKDAAIQVNFP